MKIRVSRQEWTTSKSQAVIALVPEDQEPEQGQIGVLDERLDGLLVQLRESGEFKGERSETKVLFRPRGLGVERLVLAGCGLQGEADFGTIRSAVHGAVLALKGFSLERLVIIAPDWLDQTESAQAIAEGIVLSTFTPSEYKTEDRSEVRIAECEIAVSEDADLTELDSSVHRGSLLSKARNLARWLTNEPGNRIHPASFADQATKVAEEGQLDISILDEKELEKRGLNAILAVARGSSHPAKLIILSYNGSDDPNESPIAFVGKGVTFDSGGISLKPAKSMEEMKSDKAGACSVLAAMKAIADLRLKANVVAALPVVENLPGGEAQRPGDVIRSFSGKTIEVINTDAEGRLILADALSFVRQEYSPCLLVDIATLTGACVVALGHVRAGLFSNDDEFCANVLKAAERCGERMWRLPLDREYRKEIESQIADIKNVGGRWGGASIAAKFLEEFAGNTPWCHIDMAGVDLFPEQQAAEGPSGFGVRTLVELGVYAAERE
jgi:leucyl aminopeptidase